MVSPPGRAGRILGKLGQGKVRAFPEPAVLSIPPALPRRLDGLVYSDHVELPPPLLTKDIL